MRHKDQRIGIFIDVQNLYHSAKNLYRARVNYSELIKYLTANRHLIRALGYVVKSDTSERSLPQAPGKMIPVNDELSAEASFFEALENAGIDLRIKDLQIFSTGIKKADWDVGMAVDAVRMADLLDVVILVTGDGDFIPLVEFIKNGKGRVVEVAAFSRNASMRLKEAADLFIDLGDYPKILLKSKSRQARA